MGSCLHVHMRGRAPEGGFCSFFILFCFIYLFILDGPIQVCKVQHRHQENKQRQWHFNRNKQPCKNNIVDSDILNIRFCASRIRTDTKNGSWYKKVIKNTKNHYMCAFAETNWLVFFFFSLLYSLLLSCPFKQRQVSFKGSSSLLCPHPQLSSFDQPGSCCEQSPYFSTPS